MIDDNLSCDIISNDNLSSINNNNINDKKNNINDTDINNVQLYNLMMLLNDINIDQSKKSVVNLNEISRFMAEMLFLNSNLVNSVPECMYQHSPLDEVNVADVMRRIHADDKIIILLKHNH